MCVKNTPEMLQAQGTAFHGSLYTLTVHPLTDIRVYNVCDSLESIRW